MSSPKPAGNGNTAAKVFAVLFGAFLGLALIKFGNPPVMDKFVAAPGILMEWVFFVWPLSVAYPMVVLLVVIGLFAVRWKAFAPRWLMVTPLAWFFWQVVSGTQTINAELSHAVLLHFAVCLICFYLGASCLGDVETRPYLFWPLAIAFVLMVSVGCQQHFGGLKESRDYFWSEVYPVWRDVPPEYIKKMQSDRIFSTVFYPNAFAGALLLLLPSIATWTWQAKERFTPGARMFLCGLMVAGGAACLYWTGSKGGWLLALLICVVALLHQDFSRQIKWLLVVLLLLAGGFGFYVKNRAYMERGATSVVARFDYWRAAWQTALSKPVFGSGPGTFGVMYQAVKKPESEMARLAHNDYLQQASDSGFPGLVCYAAIIGGILRVAYRRLNWKASPMICSLWLGFGAWAVQSMLEFTLYVPSLAWTAFALAGVLLGSTRETIRQDQPVASNLRGR